MRVYLLLRKEKKSRLTISPELGYGSQGAGSDIKPNATIIFDMEVLM